MASLDSKVECGLERWNIPPSVLQDMPYTTCSAKDFESAVLTIAELVLDAYLREKTHADCRFGRFATLCGSGTQPWRVGGREACSGMI